MSTHINFEDLVRETRSLCGLQGFAPSIVDRRYLDALGVRAVPGDATLNALMRGSRLLGERLAAGTLLPRPQAAIAQVAPDGDLEIHNYTGACPTLTYEINPIQGCHVGCLYCLVTDGSHEQKLVLWQNYPTLVRNVLTRTQATDHFFYFSPKTEAFQGPTLHSGVAHDILRAFIAHYREFPRSRARLFIASKAGTRELLHPHGGETILDLFAQLRGRMQFNTSLSIMPESLRQLLEPNAASLEDRLAAVQLCQRAGIVSNSALVQPIVLPYLTDDRIDAFFGQLAGAGIINQKPEFLTVNMECLSVIGQVLGHGDREMERELYEAYIAADNADHKKQRDRTAPDRGLCSHHLRKLAAAAARHDISTSICYWLRKELKLSEAFIPTINRNGFQCLGYQRRLFDGPIGAREGQPE